MDLKAKLIEPPAPGKMIFLPVESVVGQLAFGAVKISFGELRQLAPGTFVNGSNSVYDSRPISLPLNEILARINPGLLARRPAVQKFEVSDDISGPFGGHGRGVAFSAQPLKAPAPAAAPAPQRVAKSAPSAPLVRETKPISTSGFTAPKPPGSAPVSAPRPASPAPTPAAPAKSEPIAFSPRQTSPLSPPVPFAEPSKSAAGGNGSNGSNGNGSPVLPPFKFTAAPAPPPADPVPAAEAQPTFSVVLKDLAEHWPSEIVSEMVKSGIVNALVPLPLQFVEPGLKRGRVTMTWKDLRTLSKPNSAASPSDDLELDLPLKVVAPAFLAAQKKLAAPAQSKVAVSEEIPNLFFGFPQPEFATPPATPVFRPNPLPQTKNASAESSIPASQNPQNPKAQKVADTNLFSINAGGESSTEDSSLFQRNAAPATDFLSRQMQPKDVVAQAMALPGVAGAVVALADGLRVASEVPAEFNADTVAAFLPQIYERVNQSTRELRMGALNNVSFTVGNVPWKIFRVNSIYFAVFGRPGESFPKSQLAQLAAGLDRKSK
jgi:predicted regulator of Ras-like GTPase activity (Roadblock/LC7/MglB family)